MRHDRFYMLEAAWHFRLAGHLVIECCGGETPRPQIDLFPNHWKQLQLLTSPTDVHRTHRLEHAARFPPLSTPESWVWLRKISNAWLGNKKKKHSYDRLGGLHQVLHQVYRQYQQEPQLTRFVLATHDKQHPRLVQEGCSTILWHRHASSSIISKHNKHRFS